MTTMIEKMARAITDEIARQDGYDAPAWKFENGMKIAWLDQGEVDMGLVARAALTAMLEPSEVTKNAGGCVTFREYERHYRAMIQAALDEMEG